MSEMAVERFSFWLRPEAAPCLRVSVLISFRALRPLRLLLTSAMRTLHTPAAAPVVGFYSDPLQDRRPSRVSTDGPGTRTSLESHGSPRRARAPTAASPSPRRTHESCRHRLQQTLTL